MDAYKTTASLSVALSALLALAGGCTNADFGGDAKDQSLPETATTTCDAKRQYVDKDLAVKIKNDKGAKMVLSGEFCPQAPAELNLVFLVDFSLSMYNKAESRGNDQVKDDSCGRLAAAKAIIERHAANVADQDAKIRVGVVQFATDLVGTIPLTPLDEIDAEANVKNFCRGISGTNYKAAFAAATDMLQDETGTNIVYLISDGLPTEGGDAERGFDPKHRDAALAAADKLRDEVDSLTYNTVFLGDVDALADEAGFDPTEFLTELTGDADRVKFAEKAEDLAESILDLEPPTVDLELDSVKAVLTADGAEPTPVTFESFVPHADKDQVWSFSTQIFAAFPGSGLASTLTITAKDKRGSDYQLVYTIGGKETP